MEHPTQTRLEWMRAEFEAARRKRRVRSSVPVGAAPDPGTMPLAAAMAIEPAALQGRADPTAT